MDKPEVILLQNITDVITKRCPSVEQIILFGSRARGDAAERSDFDIAVKCSGLNARTWAQIVEAVDDISTLLRIDLIDLDKAPQTLRNNVHKEGVVIYDR